MAAYDVTQADLMAFVMGDSSASDAARIEQAIAGSAALADEAARLRLIFRVLSSEAVNTPPDAVKQRVFSLLGERKSSLIESILSGVRAAIATLSFDSRAVPALAGFRSASEAVELSFESELGEVDLRLEPTMIQGVERWRAVGQLAATREPSGPATVSFVRSDAAVEPICTTTDVHGAFQQQLEGGCYDVIIRLDDRALVLSDLEF